LSVYNNLVRVRVKKGDHVDIKQIVGDIYQNPAENNNCILKFISLKKGMLLILKHGYQKCDLY